MVSDGCVGGDPGHVLGDLLRQPPGRVVLPVDRLRPERVRRAVACNIPAQKIFGAENLSLSTHHAQDSSHKTNRSMSAEGEDTPNRFVLVNRSLQNPGLLQRMIHNVLCVI